MASLGATLATFCITSFKALLRPTISPNPSSVSIDLFQVKLFFRQLLLGQPKFFRNLLQLGEILPQRLFRALLLGDVSQDTGDLIDASRILGCGKYEADTSLSPRLRVRVPDLVSDETLPVENIHQTAA